MPIEYRVGNLLEQSDLTHLAHQANLFHTFGSGIAKAIKDKYPRAFEADLLTARGNKYKLGSWSVSKGTPTIFNLYSQIGIGSDDRKTSYDQLDIVLRALEAHLRKEDDVMLGLPHFLGCGLANGDWKIVNAMIESIYQGSSVKVVICRLGS